MEHRLTYIYHIIREKWSEPDIFQLKGMIVVLLPQI